MSKQISLSGCTFGGRVYTYIYLQMQWLGQFWLWHTNFGHINLRILIQNEESTYKRVSRDLGLKFHHLEPNFLCETSIDQWNWGYCPGPPVWSNDSNPKTPVSKGKNGFLWLEEIFPWNSIFPTEDNN